jgi:4-hydroxybenzoyl-CoA reductase subunit alpha
MKRSLDVVGRSVRKIDGLSKCAGVTKYADDIVLPRMLFCKIHRSPVPHARIRRVEVSRAAAMPGVLAVLTGADLPVPFGILPVSQDEHALGLDRVPPWDGVASRGRRTPRPRR